MIGWIQLLLMLGLLFSGVEKAAAQCGYTDVAVGSDVACAIRADDQTIDCWGNPAGTEDVEDTGTFTDIGDAELAFCGVKTDGSLACWGDDTDNIITDMPAGTNYEQVDGGYGVACAIKTDNSVVCWGAAADLQSINTPAGAFTKLGCGDATCCGLLTSGALSCFGDDSDNVITDMPAGTNWIDVEASGGIACATTNAGAVTCWGDWASGEPVPSGLISDMGFDTYPRICGVDDSCDLDCPGDYTGDTSFPVTGEWSVIEGGRNNACGITTGGNVSCWGYNGTLMCGNRCSGGQDSGLDCTTNGDCGGTCRLTCAGGYYNNFACTSNADCDNTCHPSLFTCGGTATPCANNADCSFACDSLECAFGLNTNASCTTNGDCGNECLQSGVPDPGCTDSACPAFPTTTTTTTTTTMPPASSTTLVAFIGA